MYVCNIKNIRFIGLQAKYAVTKSNLANWGWKVNTLRREKKQLPLLSPYNTALQFDWWLRRSVCLKSSNRSQNWHICVEETVEPLCDMLVCHTTSRRF